MLPTPENILHAQIRHTYVTSRRFFEARVSGVPSNYGHKHLPKWDGTEDASAKRDRYGRNYSPVWPKLAVFAAKHNVDPMALIKNRFRHTRGPRPPEPPDCMCEDALSLCKDDIVSSDELNDSLTYFQDIFKKEVDERVRYIDKYGWTPEKVISSIIEDLTLQFSDLYRFYLASVNGFADVASKYRSNAVLEYARFSHGYAGSLWAGIIPEDVIQEAVMSVS